jgi:hypothetical protein
MTLVLKENSPEIVQAIKDSGITVCGCVKFKNSVWLDYSGVTPNVVHAVGYYDEELVGTKSVEEELNRFVGENKDIVYCKDVNEFISKIKEIENGRSNKE